MNHLQPQAAGLPSGSFGKRRSASSTSRSLPVRLAAPQRQAHAAGSVLMGVGVLWFAAVQAAFGLGLPLPVQLAPWAVLALLLGLGAWPLFLLGLLCAALPGRLGCQALDARLLRLPLGLVLAGWVLALAGAHAALPAAALGLAISAVGLALAAGLVGLVWLEHRRAAAGHALAVPAAAGLLLLLAVGAWAAAVALALR